MSSRLRLGSIRPLIRYVDQHQAVIDTQFQTLPPVPTDGVNLTPPAAVDVYVEINSLDGFHDEGQTRTPLDENHNGRIRFDLVEPERWWPAGMGHQNLYELKLTLLENDEPLDEQTTTIGLTSVRQEPEQNTAGSPSFLVNGKPFHFDNVLTIDRIAEQKLLPATGQSLLFVRDHFGTELLYEAADRAGILLLQSIPLDAEARVEDTIRQQIDRIAGHPCLAGWYVGHLGDLSDTIAQQLTRLDPTHQIIRQPANTWAA
ncbi:hypothetical protein [Mucisphaera sp.]|uniref:hypothetical protein n=1 Tax=Mucisphaera sp. TaxID=2913024 RepID=UPI003D0B302D